MDNKIEIEFLGESNAIERVYDEDSLEQAIVAWEYLKQELEINMEIVLKTHFLLMKNQPLGNEEKGFIRTCPVYIGGREGLKHNEISKALKFWIQKMNYKPFPNNAEEFGKDLHVQYEHIHPFVDGNGRTGRMFMNWYRIRNGLPILVIHEGEEQFAYYKWFK